MAVTHPVVTAEPNDPDYDVSADAWNQAHTVADGSFVAAKLSATATDKVFGRSTAGAGSGEEIPLTAAGRALIDDADAAAQRATLGIAGAITGTKLDDLTAPDDNTDLNATTSAHGLMPKGTGSTTTFFRSDMTQATPAGASPPACYESFLSTNQAMASANTWYSHSTLALTPPAGDYLVFGRVVLQIASALNTGCGIKIATGGTLTSGVLSGDTAVADHGDVSPTGLSTNDHALSIFARVTVDGSTAIRVAVLDSRASDGTILTTANNATASVHAANKASSIIATRITSS